MNIIDEWLDSDGAKRDALKFKNGCYISGRRFGKTAFASSQIEQYLKDHPDAKIAILCHNGHSYYKELINSVYGYRKSQHCERINKYREEEKNKMADCKQEYTFIIKNLCGDCYDIVIEKDFRRRDDPYCVSVYYLRPHGEKKFASYFGYRIWEQVETQFMYDLINNGFTVHKDCRDIVTQELKCAKSLFSGSLGYIFNSPYQGGYTNSGSKAKPFELMPKIEKVIFNPPATIVQWKDGTKTVVKCQEGDEFDWEKGLAMAYVKRAYGNERSYYGLFKKNEPFMNLPSTASTIKSKLDKVKDKIAGLSKEVVIIVPKDLPVTEETINDAYDLIVTRGRNLQSNGVEVEQD